MKIAICENSRAAGEKLRNWVAQYCALYQIQAAVHCFFSTAEVEGWKECFDIVFLGFSGSTGFYQARLLRERDQRCKIILVDDTPEYAVRCVRLHCTDFILRPVDFRRVVQSMRLALGGGFP